VAGFQKALAFRSRHPRFQLAILGAAAIAAFSVLGGACTVTPVTGPASASAVHAQPAPAPQVATPALTTTPSPTTARAPASAQAGKIQPAHIVIVLEENESPKLLGKNAPYIASLGKHGANFTNAYAETHPSQPNYLALFSGSTHGITSDSCPHSYASANIGSQIIASGRTFKGYAESMPSNGYTGCSSGTFARKHTPWIDFTNVPRSDSVKFTQFPKKKFSSLPTISFVTPNLCDDMHDCSVATGDKWLKANMSAYAAWAKTHNSLLIVTFDEAEDGVPNRIPLVVYGQQVLTGSYAQKVNHYSVLRTIEDIYGLACIANSCDAKPLAQAFKPSAR